MVNPAPALTSDATAKSANVKVAAIQMSCTPDMEANLKKAEDLVRSAAAKGAQIVLLQELFASRYFPIDQVEKFDLAVTKDDQNSYLARFRNLAKELKIVLPLSFYEKSNKVYFNSVEVIDADGKSLGIYRKSHIPDSPGYHEKWHFSPGDSGFRVFKTKYCTIGVGICWDQWFPETARCLALLGAELLLFPTAIGSEPQDPTFDSSGHWRRCLQGHAAANIVPVIAANRVGREESAAAAGGCGGGGSGSGRAIVFYGSSFMADHTGRLVEDTGRYQETGLVHAFNLAEIATYRSKWGVFRDRRPELYAALSSLTGCCSGSSSCGGATTQLEGKMACCTMEAAAAAAAAAAAGPPSCQSAGGKWGGKAGQEQEGCDQYQPSTCNAKLGS